MHFLKLNKFNSFKYSINYNRLLFKLNKATFCQKISFRDKYNFRKFGQLGTFIYLGISISTFTTFYFLIKYKYIDSSKLIYWLENKGYNTKETLQKYGDGKINFALAYL